MKKAGSCSLAEESWGWANFSFCEWYNHLMKMYLLFAGIVGLVAVLYAAGCIYDLFWHWWWYDIALHTLAGAAIGVGAVRVSQLNGTVHAVPLAITAALVIGIGWELLEQYLGLPRSYFLNYMVDTTKDLVMDIAGAVIGVSLARAI